MGPGAGRCSGRCLFLPFWRRLGRLGSGGLSRDAAQHGSCGSLEPNTVVSDARPRRPDASPSTPDPKTPRRKHTFRTAPSASRKSGGAPHHLFVSELSRLAYSFCWSWERPSRNATFHCLCVHLNLCTLMSPQPSDQKDLSEI